MLERFVPAYKGSSSQDLREFLLAMQKENEIEFQPDSTWKLVIR